MKNKVCLITGATSGMGLATAVHLAEMGASLALVCRNKSKGDAVLKRIIDTTKNDKIKLFIADLSSQKEIKTLAVQLKENYPVIDVLINNAGAIFKERTTTVDGLERSFALNHIAYFSLTGLLLDNLKAASEARIVNVASQASMMGTINFDDLQYEKSFKPFKVYAQSKLANIMFTYFLAEKIKNTNITVNCLHPGVVRTGFGKEVSGIWGFVFKQMAKLLRSAEKGAETIIWLASAKEIKYVSGKYFKDKKEIKSPKISYNKELQQKLWAKSEEISGINY